MSARSIWKGSISFGLVNIPIKLYTTTDNNNEFSFNQLDKEGHRIQYKKWCPIEEREIPYSEIRKGYEISKDKYVLVEKEDLEKIKAKTTKTIDIKEFIDTKEFDPILVEKSYYVAPDNGSSGGHKNSKSKTKNISSASNKAYNLFVSTIRETDKIAIGKVVLKDREHLVALRSYQKGLIMHQLMYQEEIKPIDEVEGMPGSENSIPTSAIDEREIELGKLLVDNLTNKEFDASQYSDDYAKQLENLISAKSQGKVYTFEETMEKNDVGDNLLEALKASVQKSKSGNSS
ncbi:MAG TPA: Ku protein [Candidatus Sulfopaludibacter sp.]|nr:Ku protein [Candidatus Sulfopaludibacter sp.]